MSSSASKKKRGLDADSEESSVSSVHENGKKPRTRWSDISRSTTNEPSSASATVSTGGTRHPTAPLVILSSFPAAPAMAAPAVPRSVSEKKPRRAGFREQFLQKLRVMLDRESQNNSSTVQWSTDGGSFIVTDHAQFEEQTIPTYFDNQIVFASFQRKLQRWGFQQRTSRRTGHCEFCSPTFKRLGADKEPGNDGRGGGAFTNPALTNAVVTRHPTGQSGLRTLAAAAAAAAPPVEKEPREVGFRGEFLQKLRVMLDKESQNNSSTVQWSTDGNSFIVTDHTQFEAQTIPTYFDNQIVFASFQRKLQRWGFKQRTSRRTGHNEFCSPTFKRLGADRAPAATAVNTNSNAGGGASIQVQQEPTQASSPMLQQVSANVNQPLAPNPPPTEANSIMALLSNILHDNQQPSITTQQSVLNYTDANNILQGIVGSNPLPLLSSHFMPSHQPVQNHATQLNNVDANNYLQSIQPNPTVNLLNTAMSILAGGQAPSSQVTSDFFSSVHSLMSILGTMLPQPTLLNSNTSTPMSQLLVLAMQRVVEEELQRRAQVDTNFAIVTTIQQILGQGSFPNNSIVQTQQDLIPPSRQTLGSNNDTVQPQQVGAPLSSAGNMNIQAGSVAAILLAARRGEAAGQREEGDAHSNGPEDSVNEEDNDDDYEGRPPSRGKRKSPDDDQYDADNDTWNERLRPRKKSPRKK